MTPLYPKSWEGGVKERLIIFITVGILSMFIVYAQWAYKKEKSFILPLPNSHKVLTGKSSQKNIRLPYFTKPLAADEKSEIINENNLLVTNKTQAKVNNKKTLPIKASVKFTSVTNAYETSSRDHKAYSVLSLNLSYSGKNYTTSLTTGITQYHTNYTYPFEVVKGSTDFNNSTLTFERNEIIMSRNFSLSYNVNSTLATSYLSRRYNTLEGSFGASSTLNQKVIAFNRSFLLSYNLSASRLIHKLTRSAFDTANIKNIYSGQFSIGHKIFPQLSLNLGGGLSYYQTYQNSLIEAFNFNQSLILNIQQSTFVALGMTNKANTFNPAGDSNISFFDERSTNFYGSIAHNF